VSTVIKAEGIHEAPRRVSEMVVDDGGVDDTIE
jgi:hypothetical protein